jgi:hypothetical protein
MPANEAGTLSRGLTWTRNLAHSGFLIVAVFFDFLRPQ